MCIFWESSAMVNLHMAFPKVVNVGYLSLHSFSSLPPLPPHLILPALLFLITPLYNLYSACPSLKAPQEPIVLTWPQWMFQTYVFKYSKLALTYEGEQSIFVFLGLRYLTQNDYFTHHSFSCKFHNF